MQYYFVDMIVCCSGDFCDGVVFLIILRINVSPKKLFTMKKYWKTIGIAAVAAGVLYYPAMRLYKYLKARNNEDGDMEGDHHIIKQFSPAYRGGKHKHNHRRPESGPLDKGAGLA